MVLGINSTTKPPWIVAISLTYWAFCCRDRSTSPAMGLKTWEYLGSSIKNAAMPAKDLDSYLNFLCSRLVVKSLKPSVLDKVIAPEIVILRQNSVTGEIMQLDKDQSASNGLIGWDSVLSYFASSGITAKDILKVCREQPVLLATHIRLKYEEDKLAIPNLEEEIIDV